MNETVVNFWWAQVNCVWSKWGCRFRLQIVGTVFPRLVTFLLIFDADFIEEHFEGFLVDSRGGGGAVEGLASKNETRALPHSSRCHRGISAEQRDWQ